MLMVRRLLQDDEATAVEVDPTQRASAFNRPLAVLHVEIYRKLGNILLAVEGESLQGWET